LRSNPSHFETENNSFQYSVKIFSWFSLVGGSRNILSLVALAAQFDSELGHPLVRDIPWFSLDPQGKCYTKASWMTYASFLILNITSHINAVYSKPMTACLNLQYYLNWMNTRQQIFFHPNQTSCTAQRALYLTGLGSSLPRDEIHNCENHSLLHWYQK